jgi:hypothetical protein
MNLVQNTEIKSIFTLCYDFESGVCPRKHNVKAHAHSMGLSTNHTSALNTDPDKPRITFLVLCLSVPSSPRSLPSQSQQYNTDNTLAIAGRGKRSVKLRQLHEIFCLFFLMCTIKDNS